ncbi:Aste57867_14059 [Aphanomyces stellatus]|uniref:Aste57867_14059 protein n=1 Tax=Aphanomyces stellatus TaxID=120398 RepID=A0A485KZQ6_9STRA|nr:hypothetical protein As57867_014008 [Aphanomyces stellatus]VFT90887.1 Aste57867_14059 [Aphanomyces stellatus]
MLAIVGVGAGAYAFPDVFSIPMRRIAAFSHRQEAFLNANMELLSADEKDNWSKPPRLAEPTVEGIYAALDWSWSNWFNYTGFTHLSEKEDESVWHVLNQRGTGPVVAALGDSHLTMLAPRFKHLFDVATAANQPFPTMYYRGRSGTPPLTCAPNHTGDVAFIKSVKPKVVFYSTNWIQFLRAGGGDDGPKADEPKCCHSSYVDSCDYQNMADVHELLERFKAEVRDMIALGARVFVATVNPEGPECDPLNMLSGGGVGAVAPISRAAFRKKHDKFISIVEAAIQASGATMIDYSDNQCYNDVCEVVSMREGVPMFQDPNHFNSFAARNYLTVLDQIVEAAFA